MRLSPTRPPDPGEVAVLRAELKDAQAQERGRRLGFRATLGFLPLYSVPLFIAGGFVWYLLIPPVLWSLVIAHFWRKLSGASEKSARLLLQLEAMEGPKPKTVGEILGRGDPNGSGH